MKTKTLKKTEKSKHKNREVRIAVESGDYTDPHTAQCTSPVGLIVSQCKLASG